ncbi:hypothetical protein DFH27DRAFT_616436 [Peziza echinospora]|nr:hypothetical protein DFH27DRAFT_616436 [Peziza echinospora]
MYIFRPLSNNTLYWTINNPGKRYTVVSTGPDEIFDRPTPDGGPGEVAAIILGLAAGIFLLSVGIVYAYYHIKWYLQGVNRAMPENIPEYALENMDRFPMNRICPDGDPRTRTDLREFYGGSDVKDKAMEIELPLPMHTEKPVPTSLTLEAEGWQGLPGWRKEGEAEGDGDLTRPEAPYLRDVVRDGYGGGRRDICG